MKLTLSKLRKSSPTKVKRHYAKQDITHTQWCHRERTHTERARS